MGYNIDITMTATLRPDIINATLKDIKEKVMNDNNKYRLILNIDQVGENVKPKYIIEVARRWFPNDIIFNISDEPSFPKAVKWVWSKATSPYIFHCEDDWIFTRKINMNHMIDILNDYDDLSSLRLSKHKIPNDKNIYLFNCSWEYIEDGFYLANDWKKQFGLNPILIKKSFIDEALPNMVDNYNPEKQFRQSQAYMEPIIKKWKYGIFSNPGEKASVLDRGLHWRKQHKFVKPEDKTFLVWNKKGE